MKKKLNGNESGKVTVERGGEQEDGGLWENARNEERCADELFKA